jgi:type IV pilus assembly protein PilQ
MRFFRSSFCSMILLCLLINTAFAMPAVRNLSLALQSVNLPDAIRIVGKFMHLNLVVSSAVAGSVSLQLQNAAPDDAFNLLLASQGLAKSQYGNVLYVAPVAELLSRQDEEWKRQEAVDERADLVTRVWQMYYAKAEDVARLLQDSNASLLSKRGHVRVDTRTNKLCVQELPKNFAAIEALIRKVDVPVKQVLIEARLASVDNDFERELGVSFASRTLTLGKKSSTNDDAPKLGRFSLAVAKLADGSFLDIALSAMESEGRGELISSPSLFTANQQTASIESGEEIPYQEMSSSGGTGVAFKKAVVSLKVTPQIMPGNKVLLQLQVNQDRPSARIVLGVPAISTRQITTNILVGNGQTLVLGGIYELNKEHDERRIPFLGKIPLVGLLFQQQNAKESKRELLIFVTPKIIS